ncbi:MAG: hypothetical protein NZ700_03195 [Gemmataceae bacterium]|nr:hypothetical protein [Gemmataceae bacterium]MDW8267055.1 hypothetical protein [Gemmataceae bacterium]
MLPDRLARLLTSYIDGELTARQRRAVQRLLQRSPEARRLLAELRGDSALIRSLPARPMRQDLSQSVLQAIALRGLRVPPPRRAAPRWRLLSPWLAYAVAASVLLMIGTASFLYFDTAERWDNRRVVVQKENKLARPGDNRSTSATPAGNQQASAPSEKRPDQPVTPTTPSPVADTPKPQLPEPPAVVNNQSETQPPKPPTVVNNQPKPEPSKPGPSTSQDELTTPRSVEPRPDPLQVTPPRLNILAVRELDLPEVQKQLTDDLARTDALRLELFCLDSGKAFERIQAALQGQGVRLVFDPDAQAKVRQKAKVDYVFYTEDLTATELAAVLRHLASEDKKAAARRPTDGQFGKAVLNPLSDTDRRELAALLGVPVGQLARSSAMSPASRKPERAMLVVSYTPSRSGAPAREVVKQFLDSRGDRRPESLQVLLVLRNL